MRIGQIWGIEVRFDPLLVLVLALAVVAGYGVAALLTGLALVVHEGAHVAWAEAEGLRVRAIRLHPLGGRADIPDLAFREPRAVWATAAAGPLANLAVAAVFAAFLRHAVPTPWGVARPDPALTAFFVDANLALAGLNLLPVLPLDGGQAVRVMLGPLWGEALVVRRLALLGTLVGVGMAGAGAFRLARGESGVNWIALGGWVVLASRTERRSLPYLSATGPSDRRAALARGRVLPGRILVASAESTVLAAYRRLSTREYHLVYVTDRLGHVTGVVDEACLERTLEEHGPDARLGDALGPPPGAAGAGSGDGGRRMV